MDDPQVLRQRDAQGMLEILARFDRQLEEALEIGRGLPLRKAPEIHNVLISGLGGSAIGGDFLKAYLGGELKIPLQVNRHYSIPSFVGPSTLALLCSYSGNTEETISAFEEARSAGAAVVCITSNGRLEGLAERHGYPVIRIPGGYPPRTALGYSAIPILGLMARLGMIRDHSGEVRRALVLVRSKIQEYGPHSPLSQNRAKQLAFRLQGRLAIIYGSQDRLEMVAMRWRSQFSENGKMLAYSSVLPEMNHNEIVGWRHPEDLLPRTLPVFLRDRDDHPRVSIRTEITRDLLAQKAETVLEYWTEGDSWLERLWSLILLGDYASVYLAFLNDEDPTPVQVIDYLKGRLKELETPGQESQP